MRGYDNFGCCGASYPHLLPRIASVFKAHYMWFIDGESDLKPYLLPHTLPKSFLKLTILTWIFIRGSGVANPIACEPHFLFMRISLDFTQIFPCERQRRS